MTCTFLAAMAIGALAPADEPKLDKFNAVFHDPVIAPYSELILFHASLETQQTTHSLWLLGDGGKAKQVVVGAMDPVCVGVLPNDPVAVVTERSTTDERIWLANLRDVNVVVKVPAFGLKVRRSLSDQLTKNLLLVASDGSGALGLYRFPIESWYKASAEEKENFVPRKVWSLALDPVDLVFSRDGSRVAMLKGNDLQILTIGEDVTSRTLSFQGSVVHPRDFHPKLDMLMYESKTVNLGLGQEFGEVGVLDLGTGKRRTAIYFAEDLEPNKDPKFDASGAFMFVDTWGDRGYGNRNGSYTANGAFYSVKPRTIAFPIRIADDFVSLVLYDLMAAKKFRETHRPVMVTYRTDKGFLDAARRFSEPTNALGANEHSPHSLSRDKELRNEKHDFKLDWRFTKAYSPTKPGVYVQVTCAALIGRLSSVTADWNFGQIERYDAGRPPVYEQLGKDHFRRDENIMRKMRDVQGDVLVDTDIAVFDEPVKDYTWWVLHYPDWSHYGQ